MRSRWPRHQVRPCDRGPERQPASYPFGDRHHIRNGVEMLRRPHLSGAPHAGLHFIENQQNTILAGNPRQFVEELSRWNDVAAFSLHGLQHNGGGLFGGRDGLEQVLHIPHAFDRAVFRLFADWAAVAVWIWRMYDPGHQRSEARTLDGLARGKGKRAERTAVKRSEERDDAMPSGGVARHFDGALDRLGA